VGDLHAFGRINHRVSRHDLSKAAPMKGHDDPDLVRRQRVALRTCVSQAPTACHAVFLEIAAHYRDWPSMHRQYLTLARIVRNIGKLP
jgi:hypothetical protein